MRTHRFAAVVAATGLILLAANADADPVKCKRTIAKESAKHRAAVTKILQKCKEAVIAKTGGSPGTLCPDGAGAQKIADAGSKMKAKIAGACGGANRTCENPGDDDPLASINWGFPNCMGFKGQCDSIALTDCSDIGDCLECIGNAVVELAIDDVIYDQFEDANFFPANASDPAQAINKCQVAIGKNAAKFLTAKEKILNKCWDAKLSGKPGFADGDPCPDTDPSVPNKSVAAIVKAEQKKVAGICKACGAGGDADKNGDCDSPGTAFALDDIIETLPDGCPDVQVPPNAVHPGGLDCSAITVTDLQSYVDCIDCVLEFEADCATSAGVGDNDPGAGIDYPFECNMAGPTPTPSPTPGPCGNGMVDMGEECDPTVFNSCPANAPCAPAGTPDECTCPTGTFSLAATAGADLDTGWTGISHDQAALVGHLFDAQTYGCTSGGPDTECSFVAEYAVPFFGPPLPLSAGAVPVCVVNEIVGDANGTLDLATGELHYDYDLISRVHTGITSDQPCPTCVGDTVVDDDVLDGTCNGGANNNGMCDADAVSPVPAFGATSFNCSPVAGANIGNLSISFVDANTGTQSASLSAASPNCRAFGFTTQKCFCDTCAAPGSIPCFTNADCPGGVACGGLRCSGGGNAGNACTAASDCPGGSCTTQPGGTATAPNACNDGICSPGGGPDDGVCMAGPTDPLCAIEQFRGCMADSDCPLMGDSCTTKTRECFGSTVSKTGTAGIPNGAYAGLFCIPPTTAAAVNQTAGLSGLGALRLPYTLTVNVP
jgi:hypothetical protein